MIFGSFSINAEFLLNADKIREVSDSQNLVFYSVVHGGFSGGYYLNKYLPWSSDDFYYSDKLNDVTVLMSGSVYNKSELLHLWNITTPVPDPELVANLFRRDGPDFVKKLNGDFAIFLLQPAKKQAYLFRDHLGIRPIAYNTDSQNLFFSSDITGLCRAFSDGRAPDSDYLMGYFKYVDYRKTPCQKVRKLLPGHFLHFSEGGSKVNKYWAPERIRTDKTLTHDQMLVDLRTMVWDAVQMRCDNRFRAGAHVSSGIDSGIVSALARKEYPEQEAFYGFSWSPGGYTPGDVKFDEREIVIKSCEKTGIIPVFSNMDTADFPHKVLSFHDNHGYFSEDKTVEQAVALETNLIFSGWGGDEFISTAATAIEPDLLRSLKLRLYLKRNQIRQPDKFIKNVIYYVLYPALSILDRNTKRSFKNDARYLKKPFKKSDRKAVRQFYFHTSRHHHHIGMLNFYHLQARCESWFVLGYRKGVEYRYPLLDKRIIEYMLQVPSELLCKTDYFRPILREISEGILPEEIRWNWSKNDLVYWAWMDELFGEAAIGFMNEVDLWRGNPDLHFVDFDLLTKDILKYKESSDSIDAKVLFRALVYIKAIHEYTIDYRK